VLARIQQLIVLTIACAAIAFTLLGAQHGMPWLGLAVIALAIAGYTGAIAFEFGMLRASYAARAPERPTISELFGAWIRDIIVAPRVFLWNQPFRSASEPDHVPSDARGRTGVVLVHGFFCNRGLWNPWCSRLRSADVPFVAVNLEPVLGSIDGYGATIAAAVDKIARATGRAPIVVAHSMGGLAVRACLASRPEARIERLITIATPHAGTRLARHAHGVNAAQMREGSAWLRALACAQEEAAHTPLTCFWSRCDNIVFPTRNATVPNADNRELAGAPHVAMAFHPAVIDEVERAAKAPPTTSV